MPGVMQPGIADPGRLKQCFPFAPVGTWIDRLAGGLAPDEPAVVPQGSGCIPFGGLGGLVVTSAATNCGARVMTRLLAPDSSPVRTKPPFCRCGQARA